MKKFLIALLMMAVVFVGAFADPLAANDKAQLQITTEVNIQYPVFSIGAVAFTTGSGTLGNADVMAHGSVDSEAVTIADDVLTSTDTTIKFEVRQTALSRIKGAYTLSVSAKPLVLTRITNQDGTKTAASDDEKAANQFAVSAAPAINTKTVANTTMTTPSNGVFKVAYDGKKVKADTLLADFSYTWSKNEDAAAGIYEADVTLTITSIN